MCAVSVLFVGLGSASAAGDHQLDVHVISDPFVRGIAASPVGLTTSASGIAAAERNGLRGTGTTVSTAAEGWHQRGSRTRFVVILLSALDVPGETPAQLAQQAGAAASAAGGTFCSGASGSAPLAYNKVDQVPNSGFVECSKSPNGLQAEAITTARSNVFAMVVTSSGTFTRSALVSMALRQYRKLPSTDTFTGGGTASTA